MFYVPVSKIYEKFLKLRVVRPSVLETSRNEIIKNTLFPSDKRNFSKWKDLLLKKSNIHSRSGGLKYLIILWHFFVMKMSSQLFIDGYIYYQYVEAFLQDLLEFLKLSLHMLSLICSENVCVF